LVQAPERDDGKRDRAPLFAMRTLRSVDYASRNRFFACRVHEPNAGLAKSFDDHRFGIGDRLLNEGFQPEDFAQGDESAYFAKQPELAQQFAEHYGEGALEVQVPKEVYDARLMQYEQPYQDGPHTELPTPTSEFGTLNNSTRILNK
jgi:hypothetical protein